MSIFVADEAVLGVRLIPLTQPGIALSAVMKGLFRCDSPCVEVADSVRYARAQAGEVVTEQAELGAFVEGWMLQVLECLRNGGAAICAVTSVATHEAVGGGGTVDL
jgi:N-acyl-L-homoserine lactone synthetase